MTAECRALMQGKCATQVASTRLRSLPRFNIYRLRLYEGLGTGEEWQRSSRARLGSATASSAGFVRAPL